MIASRKLVTTGPQGALFPLMAPCGHVCDLAGISVIAMPPGTFDIAVSIAASSITVVPDGGLTTRGVRLNGTPRPPLENVPDGVHVVSGGYDLQLTGETTRWDLTIECDEPRLGELATEAFDGGTVALPESDEYRDRATSEIARRAIAHLRTPHVEPLYLDGLAVSILMREIGRHARGGRKVSVRGTARRIARAIEYADSHLGEALSVARLADVAAMSPVWFVASFTAHTRQPVHAWVLRRRLERARALLVRPGTGSIADVALACGFGSQSHLTTRFGQAYGITPLRWRGAMR